MVNSVKQKLYLLNHDPVYCLGLIVFVMIMNFIENHLIHLHHGNGKHIELDWYIKIVGSTKYAYKIGIGGFNINHQSANRFFLSQIRGVESYCGAYTLRIGVS